MKDWIRKISNSQWEKKLFPICLILGVLFFLFSNNHVSESTAKENVMNTESVETYESQLEKRLEETLSLIEGAGRVKAMIILKDHGKLRVEKEVSYNHTETVESDSGGGSRQVTEEEKEESVIYNDDSYPFISMEETPSVQGVLILAEGAASSIVQQQIIQSVSVLLDLNVSEIQVVPYRSSNGGYSEYE